MYRFSVAEPLVTGRAKVDIIIGGITPDSHPNLSLSDPYVTTGKAILIREDSIAHSLQDLEESEKKLVAAYVGPETAHDLAATHLPPNCELLNFTNYREAREALANGRIAALHGDELYLLPATLPDKKRFRFLAKGLTRETFAVAAPLGHLGILSLINRVIAEFQREAFDHCEADLDEPPETETTGEPPLPRSLADYFANNSQPGGKKITDGEGLRRIRRRGFLKIGVRPDAPGICESCPTAGLEIKLAHKVSQAIFGDPDKVEFIEIDPSQRLRSLETRTSALTKLWRFGGAAGLIANSNWWYLGSRGKLPESLCPPECYGTHDFVGLDYYWGLPTNRLLAVNRLVEAGEGRFHNAPVWPEGLGHALRHFHRWFPDQKLMIIENGCPPLADGVTRQEYLRAHLSEVSQACDDGVPVSAYLCWSLTSNREWGHPFTHQTDFGLYHVGLDTDPDLTRHPSAEVDFYRDVIREAQQD
jgi:ABC-type amino acid transport substrate-binding protein